MIERIIVARTSPYDVAGFDWVWLVRDTHGVIVGFGTEHDYSGGEKALKRAVACFELRFDEPVPEVVLCQPPGDEVIGLPKKDPNST